MNSLQLRDTESPGTKPDTDEKGRESAFLE